MATELEILGQNDPIAAITVKKYNETELASLVGYIDQTIAWMQSYGMHLVGSEDIVALRVGVPYLGTDKTVDASTVYTNDGNIDRLITTLGVDMIKFTARDTATAGLANFNQMISFTYKSPYIHQIFGTSFIDGVENRSGYTYLDAFDVSTSKLASLPVEYGGIVQTPPIIPEDVPSYVVSCLQYIVQNPKLVGSVVNNIGTRTITGDMMYFTVQQFFAGLVTAKYNAERQFNTVTEVDLPLTREQAIKEILENIGMADAFDSLDYGGLIENMRIEIRIPASRENQVVLQGLLGAGEDFNSIFKEEMITLSENDIAKSPKIDHLNDPYSTDTSSETVGTTVLLDDVSNGYYGCKSDALLDEYGEVTGIVQYRHWYVSDEWLRTTTPERAAIVFWLGIDLSSAFDQNPCPYDEVLTIVVIIAVTVASWGTTTSAVAHGLMIASAMVSIATTIGAIDTKTGARLGLALAAFSLGASVYANAATVGLNLETLSLVIQTGQLGLKIAEYEQMEDIEEIEDLERQTEEEKKNAKLLEESGIVLELGGVADMHLSNWPVFDYNAPYKKAYDKYASYNIVEYGFRNG